MSQFFIAAAHKSSGKTLISIGLCAAYRRRGMRVAAFKKGPDYIDPGWLARAPDMPGLVHDYLIKATRGQLVTRIASEDLAMLRREHESSHRRTLAVLAGGALAIAGALLIAMETGPWFLWGFSTAGLSLLAVSAWLLIRSIKR